MKKIVLFLCLSLPTLAPASTWVGNGGNSEDIELQVALHQLRDTLALIVKDKGDPELKLCSCYKDYEGRPICQTLKDLSAEQTHFCAAHLEERAPQLLRRLDHREGLHFNWTHDSIEVREGGVQRGADAVTKNQGANATITLQQDKFMQMNASERVFLIAHELFHVAETPENALPDEGSAGPFAGEDGGRRFINSMASSIVMESYEYGTFDKYDSILHRSQAARDDWFYLAYDSFNMAEDKGSAYSVSKTAGAQIGWRHHWGAWGVYAEYAHDHGKEDILTQTSGEENRDRLGIGVAYRWLPFTDPLTFSGQSYVLLKGGVEYLHADYKLKDNYVGLDDQASSTSWTLSCNYFIPLQSGLWLYAGLGYAGHRYDFNKLGLHYKNNDGNYNLGVAYAF